MKNIIKIIPCLIFISFACASYAETNDSSADLKSKDHCGERAHERALKINAAIDATFPLLVPATAFQGAAAFAEFFAENGVFQSPGGILRGKTAIFDGFRAYAENPGEMDQHVIVQNTYWDPTEATLIVERTWYATLTAPRDFCGTVLAAGVTYSQDDVVIIRFACDTNCNRKKDCVLPGKVVFYYESFNPSQFESNFTSAYPLPCDRLKN